MQRVTPLGLRSLTDCMRVARLCLSGTSVYAPCPCPQQRGHIPTSPGPRPSPLPVCTAASRSGTAGHGRGAQRRAGRSRSRRQPPQRYGGGEPRALAGAAGIGSPCDMAGPVPKTRGRRRTQRTF
jgi:hypothetical protein